MKTKKPTLAQFVKENLWRVTFELQRLMASPTDSRRDELFSAGQCALLTVYREHARKGACPGRLIHVVIRRGMIQAFRQLTPASKGFFRDLYDFNKALQELQAGADREIEDDEVYSRLGWKNSRIRAFERNRNLKLGAMDLSEATQVADPAPSADELLNLEQRNEKIRAAIDTLKPKLRAAVRQYFFEDNKLDGVAKRAKITRQAAQLRVARGLALLRRKLANLQREQAVV